jgi:hypothetical protein
MQIQPTAEIVPREKNAAKWMKQAGKLWEIG